MTSPPVLAGWLLLLTSIIPPNWRKVRYFANPDAPNFQGFPEFRNRHGLLYHGREIWPDAVPEGVRQQLLPVGMLVVLDSVFNRCIRNRRLGRNTWIYIDEIYLLFQHEYSANFLLPSGNG